MYAPCIPQPQLHYGLAVNLHESLQGQNMELLLNTLLNKARVCFNNYVIAIFRNYLREH